MTGLQYNLMLGSAAKFNKPELFDQIMIESTILGKPLDLQTYIKVLSGTTENANIDVCSEHREYLSELMNRDLSE